MTNFIKKAKRMRATEYHLEFQYVGRPGTGFRFLCDEHGNPLEPENANLAQARQLESDGKMVSSVREYEQSWNEPAVIECDACGKKVELDDSFLNTCQCGTDYNGAGQRLAPRPQWGEETGENLADMYNGDPTY